VDWGDSPRLALIRHVFGDMTMRDVAYTIDIHRSNLYRWFEGTSNDKSTVTDRIAEFMERKREVRAGNARVLH
jgi:transposase-like protein